MLAQATASSDNPTGNVTIVKREKESPPNINRGDMTITELEESQLSIDNESMTVTKFEENRSNINREAMAITDVDDSKGEMQHDTNVDNERNQGEMLVESDRQGVVFATSDRTNGEIRQETSTTGQGSGEGVLTYGDAANGKIPGIEGTEYTYEQDVEQNATNYEDYVQQSDQIEVWPPNIILFS